MTVMDVPLNRTNGSLTHRVTSTGSPQTDGTLNNVVRIKTWNYLQLYVDMSDPIVFLPVTVITSGRFYDDFVRLIFLYTYREASKYTPESSQFRKVHDKEDHHDSNSVSYMLI